MRIVHIDDIRAGHIMARPVLDDTGNVLLNRGVAISANYIDALKAKGFTYMYVTDRKEYTRI
ncbi:MAG: hypothetical protein KJ052_07180, partial [Candidatus Hydrogenedentes bacterium]|nr:hypothetical protein [Candidatus Hydrogenedentota bacterium]